MILVNFFKNKKVIVLGLGRSGLPVVCSLISEQTQIIAIDDNLKDFKKHIKQNSVMNILYPLITYEGQLTVNPSINTINFQNIAAIVVSPGIPINHPKPHEVIIQARKYGIPIVSDIELLYKTCKQCKYIGITGTNGKSTTTALIGHILKNNKALVQVGGNIGIGALDLEPLSDKGTYVLELSSFQTDLLSEVKFNIAILLNITPDHLDRYKDFDAYKAAKLKIFNNQTIDDYAIVSTDDDITAAIYQNLSYNNKQKVIPISTKQILEYGVSIIDDVIYDNINNISKTYNIKNLKNLLGQHNKQNLAAAYVAAKLCGIDERGIIKTVGSFRGLEHRIELVLQKENIIFINDSKATNTDATRNALNTFDNIYWIAGGISKDEGIESLSDLFYKLSHVYLVGSAAANFAQVLEKHNISYTLAYTLEKSLELIKDFKINRGVVLLSPACASFDQWQSYEHRGSMFKKLVKHLWRN